MITAKTQICMVIGDPIDHSLSPLLHNAGYHAAQLDGDFVYVGCKVSPESIESFVAGARAMNIRGISCTMPHKEIIMPYLDAIDDTAKVIGAVNTVVNEDGKLVGYNTDWIGTVAPLKVYGPLHNKRVAVIGAGGAAKAMVYGLMKEGADVTIFGRTESKTVALARSFGCASESLERQASICDKDIICNATPVGMDDTQNLSPINASNVTSHHIVFDAIYKPYETQLIKDAHQQGAQVIHGTDMLLYQAMAQFELYTKHPAPESAMRTALNSAIGLIEA